MKLSLKPKAARVVSGIGEQAWWYDERGGITVVVETKRESSAVQVHIKRSALARYLKRSAP